MKKELRKELLQKRSLLTCEEVNKRSDKIVDIIVNSKEFIKAKKIGIYSPIRNEVNILKLMDYKECYLPKVDGINMDFYSPKDGLNKGSFDVYEPINNEKIDKNELDIIYIPVVGVSKSLYRIGYGKGFYDRYLKDYKGLKIVVCYDFQIVDKEFNEIHDVKLDQIIKG